MNKQPGRGLNLHIVGIDNAQKSILRDNYSASLRPANNADCDQRNMETD